MLFCSRKGGGATNKHMVWDSRSDVRTKDLGRECNQHEVQLSQENRSISCVLQAAGMSTVF